jgi:phosphoglycerol transferase MdoB-like AlkP superfamily enzyme
MEKATSSGISFSSVLFIVFIVLKLTKVIDWSWWWVSSPLWLPFVLGLVLAVLFVFIKVVIYKK